MEDTVPFEKEAKPPHNWNTTWLFQNLLDQLLDPLSQAKQIHRITAGNPRQQDSIGPRKPFSTSQHRQRIIERFISRWRMEVGNDIFPAFRLIIPQRDRSRATYGLKETNIAKVLCQVTKISKSSSDGIALLNWKQPAQSFATRAAGDFGGRCFEVLSKRPALIKSKSLTITDLNDLLDRLAVADQATQAEIFSELYVRTSAEELMWIIRIILQQMKIGLSEKTLFKVWHPDAENLFSISSNLRRVCWELYDPNVRLCNEAQGVTLMQCFQPQLAQFQSRSLKGMVARIQGGQSDSTFWIEEKLDGERIQMHARSEPESPGGFRFGFWSRRAKDYTYLYGQHFMDSDSALTQHLRGVFDAGVRSIILDGEMITWDPQEDIMVPFGSLKTAALEQKANPYDSNGWRPLYKVFDVLYLNGLDLTDYALVERRKALDHAVKDIYRRLEKHNFSVGRGFEDIEPALRSVIDEASEGLVLKNPRSSYRLNQRNDDWTKVKPEYMTEFGENLDCIIIGGYYGSGRRGGKLSSFLCGLRVDPAQMGHGPNEKRFYSFCRVGGGFSAADYSAIRHYTENKWNKWNHRRPPEEIISLAGDHRQQFERPDEWILPQDSVVIEIKAASVVATDQFKTNLTLRFPRFRRLRMDRSWKDALSLADFITLRAQADRDKKAQKFELDNKRRKKPRGQKPHLAEALIAESKPGAPHIQRWQGFSSGLIFRLGSFQVLTGSCVHPDLQKNDLEAIIKYHGGSVFQSDGGSDVVIFGDKETVHVISAIKRAEHDVHKSQYLLEQIDQCQQDSPRPPLLVAQETSHYFWSTRASRERAQSNLDDQGDSYARDTTKASLKALLQIMDCDLLKRNRLGSFRII